MKERLKRAAALALGMLLCCAALFAAPAESRAYEGLDTSLPCSLEASYHPDHGDRDGIAFRLYRVADMDMAARLTFTDDWKDIPVSMIDLDAEGWAKLASTVAGYVAEGRIAAAYTARTDAYGDVRFEDVEAGVYVLIGDSHLADVENRDGSVTTYHYEPRPEAVILPYLGSGGWVRDRVIGGIKYEVTDTTTEPTVSRRVIKVWDDAGYADRRPVSVEVALVKDGTVLEIVTLDASNAWRHDWTGLAADATYRVVELSRPRGYSVTSERAGSTFVVTNTYVPDDTPPYDPPPPPYTPPPDVPEPRQDPRDPSIVVTAPEDLPDDPTPLAPWIVVVPEGRPDDTEELGDPDTPLADLTPDPDLEELGDPGVPLEDLPQTGQTWWPVPVLAGMSVLCMGIGVALLRRRDGQD